MARCGGAWPWGAPGWGYGRPAGRTRWAGAPRRPQRGRRAGTRPGGKAARPYCPSRGPRPGAGRHPRPSGYRRRADRRTGAGIRRSPDRHRHAGTGRRRAGLAARVAVPAGAATGPARNRAKVWSVARSLRPGIPGPRRKRIGRAGPAPLAVTRIGQRIRASLSSIGLGPVGLAAAPAFPGKTRPAGPGYSPGPRAARPAEVRPEPMRRAVRSRP